VTHTGRSGDWITACRGAVLRGKTKKKNIRQHLTVPTRAKTVDGHTSYNFLLVFSSGGKGEEKTRVNLGGEVTPGAHRGLYSKNWKIGEGLGEVWGDKKETLISPGDNRENGYSGAWATKGERRKEE